MKAWEVVGYTADGEAWCPGCAEARYGPAHPIHERRDREGNAVTPSSPRTSGSIGRGAAPAGQRSRCGLSMSGGGVDDAAGAAVSGGTGGVG